jgi:hypothetical protein
MKASRQDQQQRQARRRAALRNSIDGTRCEGVETMV